MTAIGASLSNRSAPNEGASRSASAPFMRTRWLAAVLIAGFAVGVAALAYLPSDRTLPMAGFALWAGLYAAVAAWLPWVVGRTLAPDEPVAAILAMVLAAAAIMFTGVGLFEVALLLLLLLTLHRGPGAAVDWRIAAPAFGLTLVAGLAPIELRAAWPIGLATTLAFLLDARLSSGARAKASLLLSVAALGLTLLFGLTGPIDGFGGLLTAPAFAPDTAKPVAAWLGALALVGAGAALVLGQRPIASRRGRAGAHIEQDRARAGLLVALVFVAGPMIGGWAATLHALPVAGILTAVAVARALPFGRVRALPA